MLPPLIPAVAMFLTSLFSNKTDTERLAKLISAGDATQLSVYFNPSIQLTTPGKQGVYSKSQAKMILSDFFDNNKPTSATIKSKGNNENGAQYVTLELNTETGVFKVNISYRGADDRLRIHELKIEK